MYIINLLKITLTFLPLAASHGIVISPPVRAVGPASLSACGKAVTEILKADNQTSIGSLQVASVSAKDFNAQKCNLNLCHGLQLSDNTANIQKYTPGQHLTLKIWTRIPHLGWASVAIIDTKTQLIIGSQLGTWETGSVSGYEIHGDDEMKGEVDVDLEYEVAIPKTYPRCAEPGDCVLQWTWFGRVVKQTYESCVDFYIESEPFLEREGRQKKIAEVFFG